jgi:CheY-like chemotaxis protein
LFARIIEAELGDVVTDTAADGREAVESFRQRRHSVVVMDLHMPGMNGREAFAEIEKMCGEKRWPMPAVIFCTGFALPEALDRIIADGRRHCLLRKPVGPDLLVRTVKERLGSGHADH